MQDKKWKERSIKDIATAAGVGVSTVSRVLNSSGYVAPETEKRIREVIRRFHYTPSAMARGLRKNKIPVIGVLIPDITGEFYNSLVLTLQQALYAKKYLMMIINTNKRHNIASFYESIGTSMNLSGWIFCGMDEPNVLTGVPTVYIGDFPEGAQRENACAVDSDNERGGYLATRELMDGGCKNIAIITDGRYPLSFNRRYKGYLKALEEAGIPLRQELVVPTKWVDYENGYLYAKDLLERAGDVDGIFCAADRYLPGVMTALEAMGKKAPVDVQIVGFDDLPMSRWTGDGCTTIRQQIGPLAEAAADCLLRLMDSEKLDAQRPLIPVSLVRRSTTLQRQMGPG